MNDDKKILFCPFTAIECKKEHCALFARDKMANERKCAFAVIAENTSRLIGIDNSANGIWGELRDRY